MKKKIGFTEQEASVPPPEPEKQLVKRDASELFAEPNIPAAIEVKKNQAVLPLFDTMSTEIVRRYESGELADEFKNMKLSSLINNLTKIIAAMNKSAIVIVNPGSGEKKDLTFLRANSAMHLTDAERQARRDAVDAEVIPPKEKP